MLENWVIMSGLLIGSLLFLFHGCVLLLAPNRYPPSSSWGQSELKLVRKPQSDLGKRVVGLCLSIAVFWMFMLPAISWMLHPGAVEISSGASPLPHGTARWDLLALSTFLISCSSFMMAKTQESVELMFSADKTKLRDKTTLRFWTIYIQLAALYFIVCSLILISDFLKSSR
jgi:hypothetical protein